MASTLGDLLPQAHFSQRHELRIDASPASVWAALHELSLGDLRLSRALVGVRGLPARLLGHPSSRTVTAKLLEDAPVPVLASDPQHSIVAGGVLQSWKLTGGKKPPALDAAALRAFAEPGWVKVGLDFVLVPEAAGTRLSTETRVLATDARTRARFGLYWLAIRAGSGVIRREMLHEVARGAQRAPR